jgi:hypothetical protein
LLKFSGSGIKITSALGGQYLSPIISGGLYYKRRFADSSRGKFFVAANANVAQW